MFATTFGIVGDHGDGARIFVGHEDLALAGVIGDALGYVSYFHSRDDRGLGMCERKRSGRKNQDCKEDERGHLTAKGAT